MKIFFLSILILYVWFTPGRLLFPSLEQWSPSYEGLFFGSERIAALILLIFAVDSFLSLMSREKILTALYYFFYPMHIMGFNRERFIVRALLTLEGVSNASSTTDSINNFKIKSFSGYMDALSSDIQRRLNLAKSHSIPNEVVIDIEALPDWYHWVLPLTLTIIFTGAYLW